MLINSFTKLNYTINLQYNNDIVKNMRIYKIPKNLALPPTNPPQLLNDVPSFCTSCGLLHPEWYLLPLSLILKTDI